MRGMVLCLLLAACGPPPPAVLTLTVRAGADQNPNPAGQPTPVAIHLYQLAATTKFDRAEVFALLERAAATLGDELSGSDIVIFAPGETKTVTKTLKPGVQALGVAVAFRAIDRATWRVSAPVAPSGPTALDLRTAGTVAKLTTP